MTGPYHRGDDVEEGQQQEAPQEHSAVAVQESHTQQHHGQQHQVNGPTTAYGQEMEPHNEERQQPQDYQTTPVEEEIREEEWDPSVEYGDKMQAKQDHC